MAIIGRFLALSRHQTVHYFRRRVPHELQAAVGAAILYRSLGTRDPCAAVRLARELAVLSDRIFEKLQGMKGKSPKELRDVFDAEWGSWGVAKPASKRQPPVDPAPSAPPPLGRPVVLPDADGGAEVTTSTGQAAPLRAERADYKLQVDGYPRANRPIFRIETEDNDADRAAAHEALLAATGRGLPHAAPLPGSNAIGRPGAALGPLAKRWLDEHVAAKRSRNTLIDYRRTVEKLVVPFFGEDRLVSTLSQRDLAALAEHVHEDYGQKLAPATRNQYLAVASSLFGWLESKGELSFRPTLRHQTAPAEQHESEQRLPFTLEEVALIVEQAAADRKRRPEVLWATAGAALLGCRIEELAQLDLSRDLVLLGTGRWALDINDARDADGVQRKALKSPVSSRLVPIHPALVELGFVAFLEDRAKLSKTKRPFDAVWKPMFKDGRASPRGEEEGEHVSEPPKWSHYLSRWGVGRLDRLARASPSIRPRKTYFHSLRHTVAIELSKANVPEHFAAAYQGHAVQGAGMNRTRYGNLNREPDAVAGTIEPALAPLGAIVREAIDRGKNRRK